MLTISHLTKTYGDKKAVDDLSLHIAPGEICGFIGHNGAGKTTTLKAVTGILPAPLCPMKPQISPGAMCSDRSSTAFLSP